MSEVLISVENIGKKFCRNLKKSLWYGLCDATRSLAHGGEMMTSDTPRSEEFWAVEDVSFEVRRGECLGLIGKNGAGKTTILKMLNSLILPDRGRIDLRGRVGGLIALGAGFNPLLTGRENVLVNGAILGLPRRQIAERMDEIVAFADIGQFMDAPVQSYSSGMSVRLGFAVAAVLLKPDILLLDEVLAVGDMGFTIKCLNAVREICNTSAVIFVSHNMQFVSSFCSHAIVLKQGRILQQSTSVSEAIQTYMACFEHPVGISGTGDARISNVSLSIQGIPPVESSGIAHIPHGSNIELSVDLEMHCKHPSTQLTITILNMSFDGAIDYPDVPHIWSPHSSGISRCHLRVPLGKIELNGGRYSLMVCLTDRSTGICLGRHQGLTPFIVQSPSVSWGTVVRYFDSNTDHSATTSSSPC
jgi:lipopolysaccharide transport system ATP-binding protein